MIRSKSGMSSSMILRRRPTVSRASITPCTIRTALYTSAQLTSTHDRRLFREERADCGDCVPRPSDAASITGQESRTTLPGGVIPWDACVRRTHPPPCRSSFKNLQQVGAVAVDVSQLVEQVDKVSGAVDEPLEKLRESRLGEVPGSAHTLPAYSDGSSSLSTVLFDFSKFPSTTALDGHDRV